MEDRKNGIETECNRKLATRDYGANKKKVYKCPRFSEDCRYTVSKMILEKEQLESAFLSKFKELVELKNINGLWELFSKEQETKINEYKLAADKIETDINQLSLKAFEVERAFKVLLDTMQSEKKNTNKNEEPSSTDNKKTKVSNQQENDDDSISFSLRKQMHKLLVNTEKTLSQKKVEKEYIMACIKELDISKQQFENSLSAIVKDFDNMDNYNQRIIVDNAIDKVLVTMHDDAINLDLIVNIHNL